MLIYNYNSFRSESVKTILKKILIKNAFSLKIQLFGVKIQAILSVFHFYYSIEVLENIFFMYNKLSEKKNEIIFK